MVEHVMIFLPLVHRELRIASRRRGTYLSRTVVAGIVVGLWLMVSAASARHVSTPELARNLFWTYGILAMLYGLLSGVFFTADSLSAERREGTLGLLFLTDLKGVDVVLGKLAATSWHGVYSLLVIVPILVLPLLMGGVSLAEMARLVVLVLSGMFYSLGLGLFISTLCRRLTSAIGLTFLIVLLQCTAPWVVAALGDEWMGWHAEHNPIVLLCPFTPMGVLADVQFRGGWGSAWWASGAGLFWMPVLVMVGVGSGLLGAACWRLPRAWRREQQPQPRRTVPSEPATGPLQEASQQPGRLAAPTNPRRLETHPCHWLALRGRTQNPWLTVAFVVLACIWGGFLGLSLADRNNELGFVVATFGAFVLHLLVKGWLALESSRRFCDDRQSGAMELLLVTPVPVGDVVQGELAAIRRSFRVPMGLAVAVSVTFLLTVVMVDPVSMGKDRWLFVEIVFWGGLILWLDAEAIARTGLLRALKSRRHHRAVLSTIARVLLPPWVGVFLFFVIVMVPGGLSEAGFVVCMRGWFVLCAVLDLLVLSHASQTVKRDFRMLSAGESPAHESSVRRPAIAEQPPPQ